MSSIEGFKTAFSQLNTDSSPLSTGDVHLDSVLDGGVYRGCITEIAGVAGAGKSQLCTMVTAKTLAIGKGVVYVDTERGFSMKRCNTLYRCFGGISADVALVLDHRKVSSLENFCKLLEELTNDNKVIHASLVIIDSIASFFRGMEIKEQSPILLQILKNVGILATKFNIAVVLINHVTDKRNDDGILTPVPYLEHVFGSRSAIRIWMQRTYDERYIEIFKNPFGPDSPPTKYIIESDGLHLV